MSDKPEDDDNDDGVEWVDEEDDEEDEEDSDESSSSEEDSSAASSDPVKTEDEPKSEAEPESEEEPEASEEGEVSDEEVARILESSDLTEVDMEPILPDPEVEKLLAPHAPLPSSEADPLAAETEEARLPAKPSDNLELFEPSAEPHTGPERRRGERKISKLNKLLTGQVDLGEGDQMVYLYLVDLSEGGLRVNVDQNFPENQQFRMKLTLDSFGSELGRTGVIDLPVQVVWQKRLVGGMTVAGLKFVDPSEEVKEAVKEIMELFSVEGKRRRFRLNRVLGVGLGLEENTRWLYPLALDLSVGGMRIRTEENLTVGDELTLKIFLQFDLPVVNVNAKVVWKEEVQPNRFQIGLEFQDVTEDVARPVQEYIDRCLAEEMGKASSRH